MIQKAGVLDTQARLHYELFRAMLEELMSGKAAGGGAGGGGGLRGMIIVDIKDNC